MNPDFAKLRQTLLDHGLRSEVAADQDDVHEAEAKRARWSTAERLRRRRLPS